MDEERAADDKRLVREVLAGRRESFAPLVERYQRMAAAAAWRYGVPAGEIDDVVSEIFIKTYENIGRYRPDHPFSTWLYRLAVNHVIDTRRRARKEAGRSEMPAAVADERPGIGDRMEHDERTAIARRALDELPDHYRDAMYLVYVEGLKLEEAARILGVPLGTVKSRLLRGRDAMRRTLERRHPEHFGGAA